MCSKCRKRKSCTSICRKLERLIPSMEKGRLNFSGRDTQRALRTIDLSMKFAAALSSNRDALRGRKRRVFDLRMNEGLSLYAIGKKLGIDDRTAAYHLQTGFKIAYRRAKARALCLEGNFNHTDHREHRGKQLGIPEQEKRSA